MNTGRKKDAFLFERGLAWLFTILLSAFLVFTVVMTLTTRGLTSEGIHIGISKASGLLDAQQRKINEHIDLLAAEYGFSPEELKSVVRREDLSAANREAAEWWHTLLTEGKFAPVPHWESGEIENAVYKALENSSAEADPQAITDYLTEKVQYSVFPLRESLLTPGMKIAEEKADLPGILQTVPKIPLLGGALCLLAAGLIALALARNIFRSLKFYGTALAGAGFGMLIVCGALLLLRPTEMLAEASEGLAGQMGALLGRLGLEAAFVIVFLLAAGYLCLAIYRRRSRRDVWENRS